MAEPFLGQIILFAGNFAPYGWAFCDGSILPIDQYSALFSLLGTTYGGNGTTTFALPDLRGRVPVGVGQGPGLNYISEGEMAGSETVSISQSNLPAHTHTLSGSTAAANQSSPSGAYLAVAELPNGRGSEVVNSYASGSPGVKLGPSSIGATGSNIPISVRDPYLGMNYIIALTGIYPSRS